MKDVFFNERATTLNIFSLMAYMVTYMNGTLEANL